MRVRYMDEVWEAERDPDNPNRIFLLDENGDVEYTVPRASVERVADLPDEPAHDTTTVLWSSAGNHPGSVFIHHPDVPGWLCYTPGGPVRRIRRWSDLPHPMSSTPVLQG